MKIIIANTKILYQMMKYHNKFHFQMHIFILDNNWAVIVSTHCHILLGTLDFYHIAKFMIVMSNSNGSVLFPWRQRTGQMYISDVDIMNLINKFNIATPQDIAEGRRRENVIRLQCRMMVKAGLLSSVSHDTFKLSKKGISYLNEEATCQPYNGQSPFEEILDMTDFRLSDFSALDSQDVKIINKNFFEDETEAYRNIGNSSAQTLQRIQNVKNYRIDRIIREFPRTEPLPQQCAHWMRAFAGLHLFPDANHRTGMAALYGLLINNDITSHPSDWPAVDIDRAVLQSKIIRGLQSDVRFNTLWLRDELYLSWHRYFRNSLCDVCNRMPTKPPIKDLQAVIEFGREQRI